MQRSTSEHSLATRYRSPCKVSGTLASTTTLSSSTECASKPAVALLAHVALTWFQCWKSSLGLLFLPRLHLKLFVRILRISRSIRRAREERVSRRLRRRRASVVRSKIQHSLIHGELCAHPQTIRWSHPWPAHSAFAWPENWPSPAQNASSSTTGKKGINLIASCRKWCGRPQVRGATPACDVLNGWSAEVASFAPRTASSLAAFSECWCNMCTSTCPSPNAPHSKCHKSHLHRIAITYTTVSPESTKTDLKTPRAAIFDFVAFSCEEKK